MVTYRGGFTTSLFDFFSTNPSRKSECCSFVCLGLLQSDKNEYSLLASSTRRPRQQNQRKKWCKRILINVGVPLLYLVLMRFLSQYFVVSRSNDNDNDGEFYHVPHDDGGSESYSSTTIDDEKRALWLLITFVGLGILILLLLVRGEYYRVSVRRAIMKRMYQAQFDDHHISTTNATVAGGDDTETEGLLSDQNNHAVAHATFDSYFEMHEKDAWSAHWTIGNYHHDIIEEGDDKNNNNEEGDDNDDSSSDCCTCLWKMISCACCGWCCRWWLVCCGMCAIGQEDRQLQQLISPEILLVDYVTFQSYTDYFWKIVQLRLYHNTNFGDHIMATSQLSKELLWTLVLCLLFTALVASLQIVPIFQIGNLLVVLALFFQAFLLLYFIHWRWNRFHLSLDAVVKYFAAGFLLCTGLALVYELLISQVLTFVIEIVMSLEFFREGNSAREMTGEEEKTWIVHFKHHYQFIVIFSFAQSFLIAATVEEMSKYFTFWMVEHPDFVQPRDLLVDNDNEDNGNMNMDDGTDTLNTHQDHGTSTQYGAIETGGLPEPESNNKKRIQLLCHYEEQRRTPVALGRAIAVAMVSTALGFACCENFIYVFFYTESKLNTQISTLIARSLFPVHPLAAAIQSIGVCRRDLEGDKSVGLGTILAPAIILHGWFDFVLMFLQAATNDQASPSDTNDSSSTTGVPDDDDQQNHKIDGQTMALYALGSSCATVFLGCAYYIWFGLEQQSRLKELEQRQVLIAS